MNSKVLYLIIFVVFFSNNTLYCTYVFHSAVLFIFLGIFSTWKKSRWISCIGWPRCWGYTENWSSWRGPWPFLWWILENKRRTWGRILLWIWQTHLTQSVSPESSWYNNYCSVIYLFAKLSKFTKFTTIFTQNFPDWKDLRKCIFSEKATKIWKKSPYCFDATE